VAAKSNPINKVAKGNRTELLARKELERLGYLVDKKPRTRFISPDLFGVFDLIAILGSTARLIQVKSNRTDFYKARKEIIGWKKEHHIKLPCEVWLYEGKVMRQTVWRIEEC